MIGVTKDMLLPTAIVGSIPRPAWYTDSLHGRSFKQAMSDRSFREQYIDAVGAYIHDQSSAGLDIVTDGDARFDNDVGGRGWFFYPLERLGGFCRPQRRRRAVDIVCATGQDSLGVDGGVSAAHVGG